MFRKYSVNIMLKYFVFMKGNVAYLPITNLLLNGFVHIDWRKDSYSTPFRFDEIVHTYKS